MDDAKLNEYLNSLVGSAMERNKDAIAAAFWGSGAAKVVFEDGDIVVKPIAADELYEPIEADASKP